MSTHPLTYSESNTPDACRLLNVNAVSWITPSGQWRPIIWWYSSRTIRQLYLPLFANYREYQEQYYCQAQLPGHNEPCYSCLNSCACLCGRGEATPPAT